jgi:hypothetical protein
MHPHLVLLVLAGLVAAAPEAGAQSNSVSSAAGEYAIDRPHPRLLMPPRRLRLLRREHERATMRWEQLDLLVRGRARMPEPGFAHALHYLAAESEESGRRAVEWALKETSDLKQVALVYDWCRPLLKPAESKALRERLTRALTVAPDASSMSAVRDTVLAAATLFGDVPALPERALQRVVEEWWNAGLAPKLRDGEITIDHADHLPLFEILHVLRDNLEIDLREAAAKYFVTLPAYHILAHYPAPFPAAENDYRIPVMKRHEEPDLTEAVRSRAAAFSMVAFDTNAEQMQFLQGWLLLDRFMMRSPYGAPYEFLWANPYQPGLSYHYLPQVFHDPLTGRLLLRSSWEDDAAWFLQSEGGIQIFRDGRVTNLKREALTSPLVLGGTVVLPAELSRKFAVNEEEPVRFFVMGLKPNTKYEIEVDDEELRELQTDRGGILELNFPAHRNALARVRERTGK